MLLGRIDWYNCFIRPRVCALHYYPCLILTFQRDFLVLKSFLSRVSCITSPFLLLLKTFGVDYDTDYLYLLFIPSLSWGDLSSLMAYVSYLIPLHISPWVWMFVKLWWIDALSRCSMTCKASMKVISIANPKTRRITTLLPIEYVICSGVFTLGHPPHKLTNLLRKCSNKLWLTLAHWWIQNKGGFALV